jgi:cytochrome c oxidase subunit III
METTAFNTEKSLKSKDVFEGLDPKVKIRAKKMLMYFIIFAIVMIFAGLTSAYLVTYPGKYWVHIKAPNAFWLSTAFILLSSLTFILSKKQISRGAQQSGTLFLAMTAVLSILFTVYQLRGWQELQSKGMGFTIEYVDGVKVSQWNRIREIAAQYGTDYHVYRDGRMLDFDGTDYFLAQDVYRTNPVTDEVGKTSNLSSSFILVLVVAHVIHLFFGLVYLAVLFFRTVTGRINSQNTLSLTTGGLYHHFLGILWIYLFIFLFFVH